MTPDDERVPLYCWVALVVGAVALTLLLLFPPATRVRYERAILRDPEQDNE